MEKDSKYQAYANDMVRNVPSENFKYLINLFMQEAAINMGSEVDDETLERVIYHIQKDYSFIPVSYIASAFMRGSLGKLPHVVGMTKLVPKTIYYWLSESSLDYNRAMAKQRQHDIEKEEITKYDLMNYPAGKAINMKIDWYNMGLIEDADWDRISLKELSAMLGRGEMPTTKDFGIC